MRAHVIESGVVTNTIEVVSLDAVPSLTLINADLHPAKRGDSWNGAMIVAAPIVIVVPQEVSKDAAIIALIEAGKDGLPEMFFSSIADPKAQKTARTKWEYKGTLRRDSTMLATAVAYGLLSDHEADVLFIRADQIAKTEK